MKLRPRRRAQGQALVEFAFTLPLFALFVFAVIQLSLILVAYYSETRMARESARWLAINSTTTDDLVAQHVQNTMLPGLVGNTPTVLQSGNSSQDTIYQVGKMNVEFSPCYKTGSSSPTRCDNTLRSPGSTLYVQMSYDISNLLFLPSTFRFGSLTTTIPTSLPVYRVYVMVE